MKDWQVSYSIKYVSGEIEERETLIGAKDISKALDDAKTIIRRPLILRPDVADVVIWDVGIMDDEVFEEAGQEG